MTRIVARGVACGTAGLLGWICASAGAVFAAWLATAVRPAREFVAAVEKAIVVGSADEPLQDDLCLVALRPVPQADTV